MDEVQERFRVDDDAKAEWALKKIREAEEERDRLLALIATERNSLDEAEEKVEADYVRNTDWLRSQLQLYMETVKCKAQKTQDTYKLLSGQLVRKHAKTGFNVNKPALAEWLKNNGREDMLNVTVTPKWAEIKKELAGDPESGAVWIAETGETIDGVKAELEPERFEIKFN